MVARMVGERCEFQSCFTTRQSMIPDSMNAIAAPIISASYPIFSACLLSESIPNPLVLPRIAPSRDETPVSPRSLAAVDFFTKSFATAHPTER